MNGSIEMPLKPKTGRRPRLLRLAVAIALAGGLLYGQDRPAPFFDARRSVHEYAGPGRENPDPANLREIRIGYFGPSDPSDSNSDLWLAARMAVEDLNASGGYQGLPYRLLPAWSKNPWGSGVTEIVRMVYSDQVLAIVSGADGSAAHLAEQVVTKALLPLINPASTDRTANLAHVPWIFSCLPGGQAEVGALADSLLAEIDTAPFLLISATDHDSRALTAELRDLLSERGVAPARHLEVDPTEEATPVPISDSLISETRPAAVVLIAEPRVSARLLREVRGYFAGPVFGTTAMARRSFRQNIENGSELRFPFPADWDGVEAFSRRFRIRWGREADFAAAQTYDAVCLIASALERSGPNRARLGDALRDLAPWRGAAGSVEWDETGQNQRAVLMATFGGGKIQPLDTGPTPSGGGGQR